MDAGRSPQKVTAIATLLIIVAVGWLVYYFVYYNRPYTPESSRTQDEKEYSYKCEGGHFFRALGRKAPRPCSVEGCTSEAYLYLLFSCPRGDRVGILLRTNPDEYRFDGYTSSIGWRPFNIDEVMNCPVCYTPGLRPAPEAPD